MFSIIMAYIYLFKVAQMNPIVFFLFCNVLLLVKYLKYIYATKSLAKSFQKNQLPFALI